MSAAVEDRPTVGERYSAAIQSSHLRVESERRGDIDLMIASGFVGTVDPMAAALYRLAVEFDNGRGELDQTRRWAAQQQREANALRSIAAFYDKAPADSEWKVADYAKRARQARATADSVESAAHASMKTELALALVRMKSLREAKNEVGRMAVIEATRQRFMQPDLMVMLLAQRVLEHWIAPLCTRCDGRGFTGGSHRGERQDLCRTCRGSGARRDMVGKTAEELRFCSHLRMQIDQRLAEVDAAMRAWMR